MSIKVDHTVYAFDSLVSHLSGKESMKPEFPNDKFPLFVSWHAGDRLRGCIGNFSPLPVHSGIKEYSIISATKDGRFRPISLEEVNGLTCSVSLLTQFEKVQDILDWEVGKHGVWIEFKDGLSKKTATYLPEVAHEQGWTKLEALDSLLRKGGYQGKITEKVRETIKLTRYQSEKITISYDEYLGYVKGA